MNFLFIVCYKYKKNFDDSEIAMREPKHNKDVIQCALELKDREKNWHGPSGKESFERSAKDILRNKEANKVIILELGEYIYTGLINPSTNASDTTARKESITFIASRYKDHVFEYIKNLTGDDKKDALEKLFSTNHNERNTNLRDFFLEKRVFFSPNEKSGTLGKLRGEYDQLKSAEAQTIQPSRSPSV